MIMDASPSVRAIAIRGGLVTALCLSGGMLVGLLAGIAVSGLPMHVPERTRNLLSALPVLAIVAAAGAIWGYAMARISGSGNKRRMTWAGGLSFAPSLILAGLALGRLEVFIVENGRGPDLPVHQVFTLLFVPAAFIVAGIGASALGLAAEGWRLALKLLFSAGAAGGLAFLLVNLGMDTLGFRVGAPGAAERATMLTVMLTGSLGAALAGGAAVGPLLQSSAHRGFPAPASAALSDAETA
jgi:hypothetical protein